VPCGGLYVDCRCWVKPAQSANALLTARHYRSVRPINEDA